MTFRCFDELATTHRIRWLVQINFEKSISYFFDELVIKEKIWSPDRGGRWWSRTAWTCQTKGRPRWWSATTVGRPFRSQGWSGINQELSYRTVDSVCAFKPKWSGFDYQRNKKLFKVSFNIAQVNQKPSLCKVDPGFIILIKLIQYKTGQSYETFTRKN